MQEERLINNQEKILSTGFNSYPVAKLMYLALRADRGYGLHIPCPKATRIPFNSLQYLTGKVFLKANSVWSGDFVFTRPHLLEGGENYKKIEYLMEF